MKHLNLSKSRYLLLMLFALLIGASPTWAQTTVLSEGFESNSLETNGWMTINPGSSAISTDAKKTGNYGYRFYYYSSGSERYLISPNLNMSSSASDVKLSFYYKNYSSTYAPEIFKVGYSTSTNETSAFTWSEDVEASDTQWHEYTQNLANNVKYIAIQYKSGDKYYLDIDDINITCEITGPALAVYDGTTAIATDYNYAFGLATSGTAKTFTLSNPGTEAAPVSVSHTGNFGAELSATSIPAGGNVTLTVTMPEASGSDVITISSTSDAIDDFVINVSGTVKDPNKLWCNFADGIPTTWTNGGVTVSKTGASSYAGSSGGGYVYDSGYGYTLTTPLLEFDGTEKMYFLALRTQSSASYCELKVEYSANGTSGWTALTLSKAVSDIPYYYSATSWASVEASGIPAGSYYIRFTPKYVRITDIYGGTESTAPVLVLSQSSYDFGLISANTTSSDITITNTGKSELTGMTITSDNENFTVSVTDNATTIAANGGTAKFNVTMVPNATGAQSATITIKSDNADDLTFTATGAVAKPGTATVDFNDNAVPAGWTNSGWTFNNGAAYTSYSSYTLTSPKLKFVEGDFLAIKAQLSSNSSSYYITIQGSSDNGVTWTAYSKKMSNDVLSADYSTILLSDIPTTVNRIQIYGNRGYIDEISGLTYAPVLAVTQGGVAVTTPAAYAFGEVGTDQTVTYNFNNTGAGTISITNVVSNNPVFTTNWTETVAAANYDLVITANYDATKAGEQNGAVTVTTTEGEFVINLTSTFLAANAPKFAIVMDDAEQTTGAAFEYGIITANATKTFTIKNEGTGALNVTSITLPDADFTTDLEAAPTTDAPLVIAAGTSKAINVTLAANGKATKSGNIVISATGFDNFSLATSAYVLTGTETVTFTSVPNGWDKGSWNLDNTNNDLYTNSTTKPYLTTPKLSCVANDFIVVTAKKYDNDSGDYIQVQYSTDNGDTWTNLQKLDDSTLPTRDAGYSDILVSNIPEGTNKLRFQGYYARIKQIAGLTYDANDPAIAVYSDAAATVTVTSGTTKDFGWKNADHSETYYIKNVGTGTLTISSISEVVGFTATTAGNAMTVAAGADPLALTITMSASAEGTKSGTFTITTDGGNFEIPVSGFVYGDKNFIDFTAESAKAPAGWSMGNWAISNNQLVSGSSSTSMTTTNFTATKGEKFYVEAISTSTSYYNTPTLTYAIGDGAAVSIADGLTSSASKVIEIDAFSAIEGDETTTTLTFTGQYVAIRRIYGLTAVTEPVMTTTAADISFGSLTAESAEETFTISNEGTATLEGLSVTLGKTGDAAEYSIALYDGENAFAGTELEAGKTITVKVKQLYDANNLGAKSDVLTIAATGQTPVTINLTGATRDGSKLYVDFEDGNIPEGWTKNTWSVTTSSGNKVAYAGFTASSLITTPLTVAEGEVLTFKAGRQYANSAPTLQVRYTTNGGVTWTEYVDYASQVTSSDFATITLSGIPAGTAVVEFYGRYFYLDDISGFTPTTAPIIALAEGTTAVNNGDTKAFGDLTADGVATYTLTNSGNATYFGKITATEGATIEMSGEGSNLFWDNDNGTLTLPAGLSATIKLTLPLAAPYGERNGKMTIAAVDNWAGDIEVNYTANLIDPTALYVDFADNAKPAGWYNGGWSFTGGYAYNYSSTAAEFITQKLSVAGTTDVLTYKVAKYSDYSQSSALTVEYSTDRKYWNQASVQPSGLTTDFQQFSISGLEEGEYYVRFTGAQVKLDDITGWHVVTDIEHDLYIASATYPTETLIPGTENGITVTATVASLIAEETDVYTKLFCRNADTNEDFAELATSASETIAANGTKVFTITANVPEAEGKYRFQVRAYYSDGTEAFSTAKSTLIDIAHTRTLAITAFSRHMVEGDTEVMTADANNQISPSFDVKVKNTGTTDAAGITVKIKNGETVVGEATADALLVVDGVVNVRVNVANMSAGEGGELSFTAEAYLSVEEGATAFAAETPVTILVTASAPKFALYNSNNEAFANGGSYDFGLVRGEDSDDDKKMEFVLKNEGNAPLKILSVEVDGGFSKPTAIDEFIASDGNPIAVNGSINGAIYLCPREGSYGKKIGTVTVTYQVDANTQGTFTLNLTGRTISTDTWTEALNDYKASIPANWTNNGWSVAGEYNDYPGAAYTNTATATLITPRLQASEGEILTFDVVKNYYNSTTYAYSTDKITWSEEVEISGTGEKSFTAPAAGTYYIRFTGRGTYLQNFIGFKLVESIPVTIGATGYTTFACVDALDLTTLPSGLEAYQVTADNVHANSIGMTQANVVVAAGTGLLLKGTAGSSYDIPIATTAATTLTGNLLVGCTTATELQENPKYYVLVNNEGTPEFQDLSVMGATIPAGKAYLDASSVQGAGSRLVIDFGDVTGIRGIYVEGMDDATIYTLDGRRVEHPKRGSLYIVNGRKVVVK